MELQRETELHLYGGLIVAVALAVLMFIGQHWHPAAALSIGGVAFGWGIERYQAIRREGTPETRDLVATALPFQALALLAWLLL